MVLTPSQQLFLQDKNILITGATGFIGSHFTQAVAPFTKACHLIVRKESSLRRIVSVQNQVILHYGSLDAPNILSELPLTNIDLIFHFAQPSHTKLSNPHFLLAYQQSLAMLTNILEYAKHNGIKHVFHACSSTVYGNNQQVKYEETGPFKPSSPRGLIKLAERELCLYHARNYNTPVSIGRIFRAYGPNDSNSKLFYKAFESYKSQEPLQITTDSVKRDYIHVDDISRCCLEISKANLNPGTEINIGSGIESTARDIINIFNKELPYPIEISAIPYPRSSMDQLHWCAAIEKARDLLDWEPSINLEQGLKNIIHSYLKK